MHLFQALAATPRTGDIRRGRVKMHRSKSGQRFRVATTASALCACVAVLAAPRFAAAALVPESESHNVTASGVLNGTETQQSFPGETSTPTSPVTAAATAPGSAATLNLAFGGPSVTGKVDSNSGISRPFPGFPQPSSTSGNGFFNLTFSVTEPTPFVLAGIISGYGNLTGNRGFASVGLLEDGASVLFSRDTSFIIFGDTLSINETGTFLPGHTYTLSASARSSLTAGPLPQAQGGGVADITLTVPEPASLALLAPASLLVLRRRRHSHALI
jgi:hypothetical protein